MRERVTLKWTVAKVNHTLALTQSSLQKKKILLLLKQLLGPVVFNGTDVKIYYLTRSACRAPYCLKVSYGCHGSSPCDISDSCES